MSGKPLHIFINYRRVLDKALAHVVKGELSTHFGASAVFLDYKSISPGDQWEDRILHHLDRSSIMISLISKDWLKVQNPERGNRRRIDLDDDWVRREIAYCISSRKVIIPLMIEGGGFPERDNLPENIQDFVKFQNSSVSFNLENIENEILKIVRAIKDHHGITSPSIAHNIEFSEMLSSQRGSTLSYHRPSKRFCEISCNRTLEFTKLKEHLGENQNAGVLHYFIGGLPQDHPESLAERFVLEYSSKYLVDYVHDKEQTKKRLILEDLPIGGNLELSKIEFQAYFENRFFKNQSSVIINSLTDFQNYKLPGFNETTFVFVFKIDTSRAHHFFFEYLEWIIKEFCNHQSKGIKYMFFYTFTERKHNRFIPAFILPAKKKMMKNKFNRFIKKHCHCFLLSELSWVHIDDVIKQICKCTRLSPIDAEKHIAKIREVKSNTPHFNVKKNTFRMRLVEDLLEKLIASEPKAALR